MLGLILQVGSFTFSNFLQKLEDLGFFRYVLPFLLIFALVFAILRKVKVFEDNKGAAILIAVAIGLLALQLDFVPAFFQNLFPKFGVGLAILLMALILAGAFVPDDTAYGWIFFGLGAVIFLIIVILSFSDFQFTGNLWWSQYGALVVISIVIIVAMILVMVTSKKSSSSGKSTG